MYALKDMQGDKVPGVNGFTMAFFQKCRSVVEFDIMGLFNEFQDLGSFEILLNATFITVIPEKAGAKFVVFVIEVMSCMFL